MVYANETQWKKWWKNGKQFERIMHVHILNSLLLSVLFLPLKSQVNSNVSFFFLSFFFFYCFAKKHKLFCVHFSRFCSLFKRFIHFISFIKWYKQKQLKYTSRYICLCSHKNHFSWVLLFFVVIRKPLLCLFPT